MKKLISVLIVAFGLSIALANTITDQTTVKEKHRKGMSHKTKDALIGAGGGIVVGRVAGAGAGYVIGAHQDKKHPRKTIYKKKVEKN